MSGPAKALRDADAFMDECHYFALALQSRVGGELAYIANRDAKGDLLPGHVVVTVAEGLHADAEGIHAEADLLRAWGASVVEAVTEDTIRKDLGGRLSRHARQRIAAATLAIRNDPAYVAAIEGARETASAPAP